MSNASKWAAALILCSFSLAFVACGDSSSGNDAGSTGTAGSTGGGTGGASGGAGGTNATGGGGGGRGGASGTAGASGGNCQMCVACVQANCASQVTTCTGNAACNAIWQCAMGCTMTLNQCIAMNTAGALMFGPSIAACANTNCAQNGCPY